MTYANAVLILLKYFGDFMFTIYPLLVMKGELYVSIKKILTVSKIQKFLFITIENSVDVVRISCYVHHVLT